MGNALRHVRGESQKNIVRFIEGLSGKYSRWDIWQDFIIMSAIAIANTMGGPQAKAREEMYRSRAEKYSSKELEVFADMLLEVVAELERDPEQDFLGELFMALGLGNEWKGYAVDVIGKLKDMLLTATPGTDQTPAALPEEKTDEDEAPDAPKEE